ncbi:polysaccharide deacetylase family protein [Paracoccaceae bacterium]|nr:polysaccharide deacetylase family protein [Paracoccaceae bacterium]
METFSNSIHARSGINSKIRHVVRNRAIDLATLCSVGTPKQRSVRCLYLHYVFDDQRHEFEQKIIALRKLGDFISTGDMVSMIRGDVPVDGKYFHLSFDDGLDCVGRNAAPILDAFSIPAIVFVNSGVIENEDELVRQAWIDATNYKCSVGLMSWQALADSGLEVGAHTRHHQRLSSISNDPVVLAAEISGCKSDIEAQLSRDCQYFAWPYGTLEDVDRTAIEAVRSAGFDASFGVYRYGITPGRTNPFMIPRHHFEPQWPTRHVAFFARGGMEQFKPLPNWGLE